VCADGLDKRKRNKKEGVYEEREVKVRFACR
jgi:hypothetical protein